MKSLTVILNGASGAASAHPHIGAELTELFRSCGVDAEIVELRRGQDPAAAARAVRGAGGVIIAAGGDGTVSGVAAGIAAEYATEYATEYAEYAEHSATEDATECAEYAAPEYAEYADRGRQRPTLGVLPLGTLNHFAKDLGIPLDLPKAVAAIAAGHTTRVDIGQVNDRVFVNNSSIGIYPRIVEEQQEVRRHGYRKWPAMAIAAWRVLRQDRGVSVTLEEHGQQRTRRTPFVFVGNNEYAIEGLALGGRARLDRGRLFVYLTPHVPARNLPMLALMALLGRARESGAFEILAATDLSIDARGRRQIRVSCDGEVVTLRTPLRYRIHPGALQVLVPPADGGSAAGV